MPPVAECHCWLVQQCEKASRKGIGSGIKMIQHFINRGGKGLSAARKRELEKAKRILQEKLHRQKDRRQKTK